MECLENLTQQKKRTPKEINEGNVSEFIRPEDVSPFPHYVSAKKTQINK